MARMPNSKIWMVAPAAYLSQHAASVPAPHHSVTVAGGAQPRRGSQQAWGGPDRRLHDYSAKPRCGACMVWGHTRKVQTRRSCRPHWSSAAEWQPMSLHSRGSWLANGIELDDLAGHEDVAAKLTGQHKVFDGWAGWATAAAGFGLGLGRCTGWEVGISSWGSQ